MLALREQSGRDLAIVGASWLDVILEQNLVANMMATTGYEFTKNELEELFGGRGYLASAGAKINVAHAFGIISRSSRDACLLLNKVRNEYAHTIEDLDADAPNIAKPIDLMTLSIEEAMDWNSVDSSQVDLPAPGKTFSFDGEEFDLSETYGMTSDDGATLLMFLPKVAVASRNDRLRQNIYACVIGAAGLGLKSWLERPDAEGGIAKLAI